MLRRLGAFLIVITAVSTWMSIWISYESALSVFQMFAAGVGIALGAVFVVTGLLTKPKPLGSKDGDRS